MYDYNYNQGRVLVRETINKYYDEEGRLTNEEVVREYAQSQQNILGLGGYERSTNIYQDSSEHTQG